MTFQLRTVNHEGLKNSKGRLIPTVVASPRSETGRDDIAKAIHSREDEMLVALLDPAIFFSNEPKSNAFANPCARESGFVESHSIAIAAVRFYTAKTRCGHPGLRMCRRTHLNRMGSLHHTARSAPIPLLLPSKLA
jgi:hypothetical protein